MNKRNTGIFDVGDIVRIKDDETLQANRGAPHKNVGLIIKIVRQAYLPYTGEYDDKITISWMGTDFEESIPEFYLEKVV